MALFGSYARDDFNEHSDIDILVDVNGRIGIGFISLTHELEDIFKKKIDLGITKRNQIKVSSIGGKEFNTCLKGSLLFY